MRLDTLEVIFIRINEFLLENPNEHLLITWHGGEPLLLGAPFFEYAAQLQEKSCRDTQRRIKHSIQSNLTLLTEGFIPSFRRLGIDSVGSSYDPDRHIRGFGRPVDSLAYNKAFLRATSLLERHGISWGIIYVATRRSLAGPLSTFTLLSNLKPGGGFNINPVIISHEGRKEYAISSVEYADFLGTIFSVWYAHRDRYPGVEPFTSLLSNFTGKGRHLSCEESGTCARRHLNIDPAGNVSQCGRSSDLGIMNWGNIHEKSIEQILQNRDLDEPRTAERCTKSGRLPRM